MNTEQLIAKLHSLLTDTDNDEIIQALSKAATMLEAQQNTIAKMQEALEHWDNLIEHQYSGSREAMSEMQYCAFETQEILAKFSST